MASDNQQSDNVSRRKFLLASGAGATAALAGCTGGGDDDTTTDGGDSDNNNDDNDNSNDNSNDDSSSEASLLTAEGSSTVYPISNKGASYWVSNAPPSDGEYWGSNDEGQVPGWDKIDTDMKIADYWASKYGFEPTDKRSKPPFVVNVGLSHSGTGCKAVRDGLVDIGNSSGNITAELDISEEERDENYVDHVVGRDGQPVVVSSDVYNNGVQQLTGEQVRKIYQDEITNWKEVGGPDKQIYVVGRAEGSGTDTSFRSNMLGDPDAPMPGVDTRQGQNHGVRKVVQQNEGAIGYMALAFTNDNVLPIAIDFDGTTYKPDKDAENTIFDSSYPLNRDLHMYTTKTEDTPNGTDKREAAFINMFLSEFGQKVFVEANNYIPLPSKDIEKEKGKLPDQA
ncbi:PstS family phosphate ABC transporter substrate-binding protein [Halomicrococcus gelatinilyticus]|uniref:PstS family phosphate ABC transporter substrate-binding protein n=1 Tax=Halomicrococcus gelatinilyticus TaxID=1702103 RepID=UPI002E1050CF